MAGLSKRDNIERQIGSTLVQYDRQCDDQSEGGKQIGPGAGPSDWTGGQQRESANGDMIGGYLGMGEL